MSEASTDLHAALCGARASDCGGLVFSAGIHRISFGINESQSDGLVLQGRFGRTFFEENCNEFN